MLKVRFLKGTQAGLTAAAELSSASFTGFYGNKIWPILNVSKVLSVIIMGSTEKGI